MKINRTKINVDDWNAVNREIDDIRTVIESLQIFYGNESPENIVAATLGSVYFNLQGGISPIYLKEENDNEISGWKQVGLSLEAQSLNAGNTILSSSLITRIAGVSSAVTLTATPTIADGIDGQIIKIIGSSDTYHVTLQDNSLLSGSKLILATNNQITLYKNDFIEFMYNYADDNWVEINRNTRDIIGSIVKFGGSISSVPRGYLACDGSSQLRSAYPALFTTIGTAWGTADATHFNLPPSYGYFFRGVAHGSSNDPNRTTRTAAATGGNTGDNVGSVQADATSLPTTAFTTSDPGNHHHHINAIDCGTAVNNGSGTTTCRASGNAETLTDGGSHTHTLSGGDSETRPINAYVEYIIKY